MQRGILCGGMQQGFQLFRAADDGIGPDAREVVAQAVRRGGGIAAFDANACGREGLPEQIRHAVGTISAGQQHQQRLPRFYQLPHAHGKEEGRAF